MSVAVALGRFFSMRVRMVCCCWYLMQLAQPQCVVVHSYFLFGSRQDLGRRSAADTGESVPAGRAEKWDSTDPVRGGEK